MGLSAQLAKHLREVYFGGNWTSVNLKESLTGVTVEQATTKFQSLNTILALVYHINYYVMALSKVLQGQPLDAHDKFSFDHPPVASKEAWEALLDKTWRDAESFAVLVENLPDSKLWELLENGKYGNYYRNRSGIIEHTHYHLGQVVLIKKLLSQTAKEKTD